MKTFGLGFVLALALLLSPMVRRPGATGVQGVSPRSLTAARLAVAQTAEFGLIVDVEAGAAELVHGAVILRRIPISAVGGRPGRGASMGRLASRRGLLPYQPVRRVVAPSDTSTVTPPTSKPLDADPAYAVLSMDSGIELNLYPNDLSEWGSLRVAVHRAVDHARSGIRMVGGVFGEASEYPGRRIRLYVTDDDARAIFRSLPEGAPVVVWMQ